jgi:hypothetical protein
MSPLHYILRRAQRRALLNRALHRMGIGVAAGVAAAIILLLFDRLTSIAVPHIGYWLLPAAGAIAAALHALVGMPDRLALAVQLDRALRLKDLIGTATTLVHQRTSPSIDPGFADLVDRDAQRLAESLDVRGATPIQASRIWAALVPLAALFIAGFLWLPRVDLFQRAARTQLAFEQQQIVQTEALQIAATINQTVADLPRDESLDEAARSELQTLDRLAQQLNQHPASPDELAQARDESAARLNELAERLAQQSQREIAAAQEIARRFEGMDKTGAPKPPMSAQEFTQALTRGDFGDAAKELQELLNDESLPESKREEAANHLRDLASHIEEQLPQLTPEDLQKMQEQLRQALHDQGVDERTIEEMMVKPPPTPQVKDQLKQQGVDEEVARELARDLEQHQQHRQIEEQTQRDAQQVQDALRQAAEQLQQQPKQQQDQSSDSRDAAEPRPSTPRTAKAEQRPERSGQPQRDETQPRDPAQSQQPRQPQAEPKPGESPTQNDRDQSQRPPSSTGEQREQEQSAESQQQSSESQQQGREQRQQPPSQSQREQPSPPDSTPTPRQNAASSGSDQKSDRQSQPESQHQPQGQRDQSQPTPAPSPAQQSQSDQSDAAAARQGESPQQLPASPSEALRRLAERRGAAEDRHNASERMKQAARELSQRMTPQERERWARQWRRQQGEADQAPRPIGAESSSDFTDDPQPASAGPDQPQPSRFQRDDLDLRGTETADQIIAEWLNEDGPGAPSPQRAQAAPPAVKQAREVAQRAVNEAAVQKRYHRAIQRYFGRLNETASKAASEPAPTSE